MRDHPENLISAYLDDQLGAEKRAQFEERLRVDSELRELTEKLKLQAKELDSLPRFSLDSNFADRLMADARCVQIFQGNDLSIRPATTVVKSQKESSSALNLRYAIGVVVSIAALMLITAFLVLPAGEARLGVSSVMVEDEEASETLKEEHESEEDELKSDDARAYRPPRLNSTEQPAGSEAVAGLDSDTGVVDGFSAEADRIRRESKSAKIEAPKAVSKGAALSKMKAVVPPAGKLDSKFEAPQQQARAKPLNSAVQSFDQPLSDMRIEVPANSAAESNDLLVLDADKLNAQADDLSAIAVDESVAIKFTSADGNFDFFKNALERNNIVLKTESQTRSAGVGGGGGRGGMSSKARKSTPLTQRAFLIEATQQQMAGVIDDLRQRGEFSRLPTDSIATDSADQFAPARLGATMEKSKTADKSLDFSNQAKIANAREIQAPAPMKLTQQQAGNQQRFDRRQRQQIEGGRDLEMLRRFILVLEVKDQLDSAVESSESLAVPADK